MGHYKVKHLGHPRAVWPLVQCEFPECNWDNKYRTNYAIHLLKAHLQRSSFSSIFQVYLAPWASDGETQVVTIHLAASTAPKTFPHAYPRSCEVDQLLQVNVG